MAEHNVVKKKSIVFLLQRAFVLNPPVNIWILKPFTNVVQTPDVLVVITLSASTVFVSLLQPIVSGLSRVSKGFPGFI